MRRLLLLLTVALVVSQSGLNSQAGIIDFNVDLTGINFNAPNGDASNDELTVNFGPGTSYHVIGIGWNLDLEAFSPSWLSEARMRFDNGDTTAAQLFLTVGIGDDNPGVANYSSPVVDLIGLGFDWTQASNQMNIHFHETFDDGFSPQATVLGGGLTIRVDVTPVPEPSSIALFGFGAIALIARRRRS